MNRRTAWWTLAATMALLVIGSGCADQSTGLRGAAVQREAVTGAETGADSAPASDGAAAVEAGAVQPEARPIPTPGPRLTMADINIQQAVNDVTKGKGVEALGIDQLQDVEKAILAQADRKLGVGGAAARKIKVDCEGDFSYPPLHVSIHCTISW